MFHELASLGAPAGLSGLDLPAAGACRTVSVGCMSRENAGNAFKDIESNPDMTAVMQAAVRHASALAVTSAGACDEYTGWWWAD